MRSCPNCNAELSNAAHGTVRCPACQTLIDWRQIDVATSPAEGTATDSSRAGMETVAADEPFLRPVPPQTPPHDASADASSDDELEFEFLVEDQELEMPLVSDAASEESRPTTDSDFTLEFLEMLPSDEAASSAGDALEDAPRSPTDSDFTLEFLPDAAPDLDDLLPVEEPAEPSSRTVTDSDRTIAFVDPSATSGDSDPPGEASDNRPITDSDHTFEFVEATGEIDPTSATVDLDPVARPITDSDHTFEFVEGADPTKATASDERPVTDSDFTMNFVEGGDGASPAQREQTDSDHTYDFVEGPAAKTRDTNFGGQTVDLSERPAENLEMLTGLWAESISAGSRTGMTIRTAAAGDASKTHLVVRARTVRQQAEPSLGGADYELLEKIGEGGMGVVYAARQASIDRMVAIKMIRRDMSGDMDQRQKFLSEAVVTGDLDHPNIVPIYDLGSNEGGALFYSMKRVQGTPWMKVIRKKSLEENLGILEKVADAIAFAHSRGVVHRDLKPENVMLGEFGEVLVMDWGLALLAPRFRHLGTITQSGGMGGTPAYMAPEMASGPLEKIGTASDVYLLGAMLYEIITGKPPHSGKDVMSCLYAVARNEIDPTDQSGDLVDIAMKAMATDPANRYATAQDFQAALRLYESHAQSITLAMRAEQDLVEAIGSKDYQDFARSQFGFQEALALWEGNERARTQLKNVRLEYAQCAMGKTDLDLAASLLDADEPTHATLRAQVTEAQRERDIRHKRLKFFVRMAQALVASVIIIVTVAFFLIRAQREEAKAQATRAIAAEADARAKRDLALEAEEQARLAEVEAKDQRDRAVDAEGQAREQRDRAVDAESQAREQRDRAVDAESQAREQRDRAVDAEEQARKAEKAEEALRIQKEYEAYIAQIGLVAAKIDENAFGYAAELLDECKPELRNWEWGWLMHLCRQSAQTLNDTGPINAASFSPDGTRVLTGSWDGKATIWDLATGKPALPPLQHGLFVHAVAYSPDGRTIVTGSDDETGEVRLWNAATGALEKTLAKHEDDVLSVVFSRDGKRLLTASYDQTARLWDVETGEQLRVFKGHTFWVWSANFSPDESHIVTASQDGTAMVWPVDSAEERRVTFTGHTGPVYSAAYSPDGRSIATCSDDKQILIWQPERVEPFKFASLTKDAPSTQSQHVTLAGHAAAVRCVRFSPDGKMLLSASHDNTVKLWSLETNTCIGTLRGHAGWVRTCSFSPDGNRVLSAGFDNQARIWNTAEYEEVRTFDGHDDYLLTAVISPDGNQVVTASRDRTAKLWDFATGRPLRTLNEGHQFLVWNVGFSPDGTKVITGAGDDTVRIWDARKSGELLRLDKTGRNGVFAVSADGRRILTTGVNKNAQYWDLTTGERLANLVGHAREVTAVACSPDGKLLYTGDGKGQGYLWDAAGQQIRPLSGHNRKISAAFFLPGGQRLVTASTDSTVAQWDVATGKELTARVMKHPKPVTALAVSRDGARLISVCEDNRLRLWSIDPPQVVRQIELTDYTATTVALSPDGRSALCACSDNKVRLWDLSTGQEVASPNGQPGVPLLDPGSIVWSATFSPDGAQVITAGGNDAKLWQVATGRATTSFSPHGAVASVAFSPDGARVAAGSWDGTIKVWDTASGKMELKIAAAQGRQIKSVAYSPDGTQLLTGSEDATAKIWDANTGALVLTVPPAADRVGHTDSINSARFSPDGLRIVTASDDKTARVWDAKTGQMLCELKGHQWAVLSAAFSQDGTRIITGSVDKSARIWNSETGENLLQLAGHTAAVTSAAFSPDGSRAATGSQDNAVKLWDARTGAEILHLKRHNKAVTSVAFAPDGKSLLTSSEDETAIVWPTVEWQPAQP